MTRAFILLPLLHLAAATAQPSAGPAINSADRYGPLLTSADDLLRSGLYEEAGLMYRRASDAAPDAAWPRVGAGWAALLAGDSRGATAHFDSVSPDARGFHDVDIALDWGLAALAFRRGMPDVGARLYHRHQPDGSCNHHSPIFAEHQGELLEAVREGAPDALSALYQTAFDASRALVHGAPHDARFASYLGAFMNARSALREEAALAPTSVPLALAVARTAGDGAAEAYEAALALDPTNYDARLGLADQMGLAGRTAEAAAVLRALARAHPDSARAHYLLYSALYRTGQRDEAHAALARSRDLDADVELKAHFIVIAQQELGLCNWGVERDDTSGDWSGLEKAVSCHRRMLHHDPQSGPTWESIGALRSMGGDYEGGAADLRTAADLMPDSADVRVMLAEALMDLGASNEALRAAREAVRIDPDQATAHYYIAALTEESDPYAAVRALRRAVAARPGYTDALLHLGRLLYVRGDVDEAVHNLRLARALDASRPTTAYWLALALFESGHTQDAIDEADRLDALDPESAAAVRDLFAMLRDETTYGDEIGPNSSGPAGPFGSGWTLAARSTDTEFWVRTDDVRGSRYSVATFWTGTTAAPGEVRGFRSSLSSGAGGRDARRVDHTMTRMEVSCSRGEVRALSTLWYDEDRQTVHSNDFKPGGRWQAPAPGTVYEAVVEAACAAVR